MKHDFHFSLKLAKSLRSDTPGCCRVMVVLVVISLVVDCAGISCGMRRELPAKENEVCVVQSKMFLLQEQFSRLSVLYSLETYLCV